MVNSDKISNKKMDWFYGIHTLQVILKNSPQRISRLLIDKKKRNARIEKMITLANKNNIAIEFVIGTEIEQHAEGNHQGVCALCEGGEVYDEKWLLELIKSLDHDPFLLILDCITDPHNLGACLRSADAAGVDAVIVPRDKSVGLTPVVEKVASGAADRMPLVPVTNLVRCMESLQQAGVWISGASDKAEKSIYQHDFSGAVALVMGAEGGGLRRLTEERCDQLLSIPMQGEVSSLNVSVATGVALYEVVRQRI